MALPHYLMQAASGRYVFRIRVPSPLRAKVGRAFLKRSLGMELLHARVAALALSARYAAAFTAMQEMGMSKEDVEALVARLRKGRLPELTLERTQLADGTVVERWQMDNDDDVQLYRQATAPRGRQAELAALYEKDPLMAMLDGYEPPAPPPAPARMASPPSPVAEAISVAKARDAWLKSLEGSTTPKTLTIKGTAINMLVDYIGSSRQVHTIGRPDMARFYQHLRDKGNSTPSVYNKQSYLGGVGGFFDWATKSGHYPAMDNPAKGHVRYTAKEKRQRKKLGFRAFTVPQIQALFAREQFARLSPGTRWAAMLGLYTGGRAGEVGQLLLTDVAQADGVPVLHVTDEGENQRVKSEVSKRVVPIHADLLTLGFLDYVQRLRDRGDTRLFPQAATNAKNGPGNWISKAFGYYLGKLSADWPKAKRGFHSLRKSVIQEMQTAGVASEMRAQIVGHELDDEHHATYSREFTATEKLHGAGKSPGLSVLAYGLSLDALRPLLTELPDSKPSNRAK